jgi:hypothetical protein
MKEDQGADQLIVIRFDEIKTLEIIEYTQTDSPTLKIIKKDHTILQGKADRAISLNKWSIDIKGQIEDVNIANIRSITFD